METTEKKSFLRKLIVSHMKDIPFGGVRVIKCIQYDKPLILYDQPYDHPFLTICMTNISLLIFVNREKKIFPFTTLEDQIESLQILEDNDLVITKEEWVDAFIHHTPMVKALDNFFLLLHNDKKIDINPPKTIDTFNDTIWVNNIVIRPNKMILLKFNDEMSGTISFQHPHDQESSARLLEDNVLLLPYDMI